MKTALLIDGGYLRAWAKLVSGDQDMIPAMKEARKAGLEVGSIQLDTPAQALHDQLIVHSDFVRNVTWP